MFYEAFNFEIVLFVSEMQPLKHKETIMFKFSFFDDIFFFVFFENFMLTTNY